MWWFIAMCVIVVSGGTLASRNRSTRARFDTQHHGRLSETDLSPQVQDLLRTGSRIRAIKQFRKETGLGLKDAKRILDTVTS